MADQQQSDQVQPISSITTSTDTAYVGDVFQHQKPRFTRTEKRQFAKERKAAEHRHGPFHGILKAKNGRVPTKPNTNINHVIRFLIGIKSKSNEEEVKEYVRYLTHLNRLAPVSTTSLPLESRITREEPKKKTVPSARKLEKIQKRREIRAERKAAWLAKKAASGEQDTHVGQTQVASAPSVAPVQQQHPPDFDEINFDDC